jgi:drug/metabolite transporter (DMT)-like permease
MTRSARGAGALPYLLLAVTIFFWGTAFRATAVAAEHASPIVISVMRAIPSAIVLLAVVAVLRSSIPRGRALVWGALSGLMMVTLSFEGIAEGTTLAGAGNAAVLVNTAPFFVLLFARAFLSERIAPSGVAGLVVAFVGVVAMVSTQLGGDASRGDLILGMGIALVAGAGFAVGILLVKATTMRHPEVDIYGFIAVQYVVGGLALIPLMLLYGDAGATDWGSGDLWAALAWVALGSSAIASLTYFGALRAIPAARAAGWQFLAPVVAVIVEIAYGAVPEPIVLAGMALVIAGVALATIAPARSAPPAPLEPALEGAGGTPG